MIVILRNWTKLMQTFNCIIKQLAKHLFISLPDLCYFLVREEHPWLFFQPVLRRSSGSIVFQAPHLSRPQWQCYSQGKVWHNCDIRNSGLHITNPFDRFDNENRDNLFYTSHWSIVPPLLTPPPPPPLKAMNFSKANTLFFVVVWTLGSHPSSETNFQDFSRTQINFSRALKFTLTPTLPRS